MREKLPRIVFLSLTQSDHDGISGFFYLVSHPFFLRLESAGNKTHGSIVAEIKFIKGLYILLLANGSLNLKYILANNPTSTWPDK